MLNITSRLVICLRVIFFAGLIIFCGCEGEQSNAILDDLLEAEEARDQLKNKVSQLETDLENTKSELNKVNTDFATLGQVRENLKSDNKNLLDTIDDQKKNEKELNTIKNM